HRDVVSGVLRRLLDARRAAENDQIGQRDPLTTGGGTVEVLLDPFEDGQYLRKFGRFVDLPVLLRFEPDPGTVGAATLIGAAETRRRGPGGLDQLCDRQAGIEDLALQRRDIGFVDQLVIHRRYRVLPQLGFGHPGPEIPADRAHIAVQQLVPGLGELLGEFLGMFQPAAGDLPVDRVLAQGDIGGEHAGGTGRAVERVRDGAFARSVLRFPLPGPRRALGQLPFVAVQVLQETVAPLSGGRGPDDLRAAGDRVAAGARAVGALPAQALLLDRRGFGFGADQVRITGTVGFAETVAADDERGGFHIVHGHPAEGFPDIA